MDTAELHQQCIVFDAHCDSILDVLEGNRTLEQRSSEGHLDLPRLRRGGQKTSMNVTNSFKQKRISREKGFEPENNRNPVH